jgi:hypothetical protein
MMKVIPVSTSFVRLSTVAVSLYRNVEIQCSSSEAECLICCKTSYCGFTASRLASRKFSVPVARVQAHAHAHAHAHLVLSTAIKLCA